MIAYIWPVALIITSNIVYQVCAKSISGALDPFASFTVTYAVAAVVSAVLYFVLNRDGNLLREFTHLNWAPVVLGLVILGLEVGFIYAYKAGWQVSMLSTVQSSFLAVALIVVGLILYRESITWNKVAGVIICLVGLGVINK